MNKVYYERNAKAFLFFSQNMTKKYHCYFLVAVIRWIIMELLENAYFSSGMAPLERLLRGKARKENKPSVRARLVQLTFHEEGFYTIIEAAPQITQWYPKILFIIAGQGTMLEQYRGAVQGMGLQYSILFLGHITEEEQRAFLQRCDVLLIPSLYEPFGIVALEGMLAKRPVLVSRVGGLQEIIVDGVNGFQIQPGCSQSLSEKLIWVIEQPEIAQHVANKGYEDVLVHYDWSEIARTTAQTYEKAVQHHKCGG